MDKVLKEGGKGKASLTLVKYNTIVKIKMTMTAMKIITSNQQGIHGFRMS